MSELNATAQATGEAVLPPATGSAYRCEAWECRVCGSETPCRIEITYEPTPFPHVEREDRLRSRRCICDEPGVITAWQRMPNSDSPTAG